MPLSHEFWIQIFVYVIGGLVFVAINSFKIGQLEAKLATKLELAEKCKERNLMIDRVYQRFDDFKRLTNDEFVRKDMCGQLHSTSVEFVKRIDEDYKAFRHEIRNSIQKLSDDVGFLRESNIASINELKNLIMEK